MSDENRITSMHQVRLATDDEATGACDDMEEMTKIYNDPRFAFLPEMTCTATEDIPNLRANLELLGFDFQPDGNNVTSFGPYRTGVFMPDKWTYNPEPGKGVYTEVELQIAVNADDGSSKTTRLVFDSDLLRQLLKWHEVKASATERLSAAPTLAYLPAEWFLSEVVPDFDLLTALIEHGIDLNPKVNTSPIDEAYAGLRPVMLPASWIYAPEKSHGIYSSDGYLVAMNIFPRNPELKAATGETIHPDSIKPCGLIFYPYSLIDIKASS